MAELKVCVPPMMPDNKLEPPKLLSTPDELALFGPCGPAPLLNVVPVVITIPLANPRFEPVPVNSLIALGLPLYVILETVTPVPNNTF